MKLSMRVKVVSVLAVFMVMMASSVWAAPTQVDIDNIFAEYNSSNGTGALSGTLNGSTVVVTGTKTGATKTLLLDMSLTIDWQANLSGVPDGDTLVYVEDKNNPNPTGKLIMTSGTITLPDTATKKLTAFAISNGASIEINGGTITGGNSSLHRAIDVDNKGGTVTITSGKIDVSHNVAILTEVGDLSVNPSATINGLVIDGHAGFENMTMWNYGIFNIGEGDELTIRKGMTLTNNGTINIYGTLINLGKIINNGTINNYSGNTLENQGKLTNNGKINNAATGMIKNTGTIDNTNGTIVNEGTIKSDSPIANVTGNPVQRLRSSSGGGCNAGYDLFGLLLASFGFLTRSKPRKA